MKNKILHYIGVSVLIVALMSSIVSPSVAIGSTPKASDDVYEENDDFASAASITIGYHSGLEASDDDWYYFPASIGDIINIGMYFSHSEGDLDIRLYDSSNNLLTGSYGISDDEHITWPAAYSGDYYIQMYDCDTPIGQLYDLDISMGAPEDDDYEDNDDFSSAWTVLEGYYDLGAFDDDWFRIWVDDGRQFYTTINYDYSLGVLGLYLYDDSEILLATSTSSYGYEFISWDADYSGYYYIMIAGINSYYEMILDIYVPYSEPDFEWTEEPDPYFEYGVNDDDEYIYNIIFDVDFTASDEFYSLLDEYLIDEAADDDYITLSDDFSTKKIINDLEDIAQQDFDFKVLINDIYNNLYTVSWTTGDFYVNGESIYFPDGGYFISNQDTFDVGIAVDVGDGWEGPEVIALEFLHSFEDIMMPYFGGDFEDDFQEELDDIEDELQNPPDWDNFDDFEIILSSIEYYYENDTHIPTELFLPEEIDLTMPFPEFWGVAGVPIFLPMEMNFEDYYNFLNDLLVEMREHCDDYPLDCEWPDELSDVFNLADMEGKVGITNVEVQSNAIGISFNLDNVDAELIDLMEFYTGLEDIGVYDFTGTMDYALEFDANWVLLSMATYIHGGLTLDTGNVENFPIDFNEEPLELDLVFIICQDGFFPPSEDQIKDGEIGENRDPGSSAFNIPSYPIAVLGIIGLVSVFALVKKHKK